MVSQPGSSWRLLLFICCSLLTATAFALGDAGAAHYYDEFNPALKPWAPAQERNIEEVFKRYEYYSIVYSDDGARLTVTHYIKGAVADVSHWRRQPDGALLQEQAPNTADATVSSNLYLRLCASCHGADRLGGAGPALLPSNLGRLRKADAAMVIKDGRPATQMPPFGKQLDEADVQQLVGFIYSSPDTDLTWDSEAINASRILLDSSHVLSDKPVFTADPLNLFMVVEAGDHHVTVLDGDRMEPVHRFASRYALHGGIKYTPDGRYAYLASRDGNT